jgi:hypothetical protein
MVGVTFIRPLEREVASIILCNVLNYHIAPLFWMG